LGVGVVLGGGLSVESFLNVMESLTEKRVLLKKGKANGKTLFVDKKESLAKRRITGQVSYNLARSAIRRNKKTGS